MSSVEKRIDTTGKITWQARWRDPAGTARKQTFPRKIDAERHLVGIESDMLRGAYVDPRAGRVTIGEYAERRWLPGLVHIRPGTRELYRSHLRTHILPTFGRRPLREAVGRTSRPISRVLCRDRVYPVAAATIHLGPPLPTASCGLPGSSGGQPSDAPCLT